MGQVYRKTEIGVLWYRAIINAWRLCAIDRGQSIQPVCSIISLELVCFFERRYIVTNNLVKKVQERFYPKDQGEAKKEEQFQCFGHELAISE